jgi:bifunctional non-homologous end joining protein LigD
MALESYRKKRNFKTTPEPAGKITKQKSGELAFVVQKHAASRLHYDIRLELNRVLLSWAVPKGPSLDPNDKRLAIHVEDHPIEYGGFEGIIPPKQYGSGTVMLWDRGVWIPKEDPVAGYKKGKLKFDLKGEKLNGGWTLIKSHGGKYGDNAWLLFKEDDGYARTGPGARVVDIRPDSVATHRSLTQIAADPERVWHSDKTVAANIKKGTVKKAKTKIDLTKISAARKAPLPNSVGVQLATLAKAAPEGEGWIHEIKYDGYRMLCQLNAGTVRIYSRTRKQWTADFPTVARAVAGLPIESAWVDGEVVSVDPKGRPSFQALQKALSTGTSEVVYYVFDLLYLNGYDLRSVTLGERKTLLKRLIPAAGTLRYSDDFAVPGAEFFVEVCKLGFEGMISKRLDSTYQGARVATWLKVKCGRRQELVIGGFTDPEGSRQGFGALLLGAYDAEGNLRYSGKVGTGFNDAFLVTLRRTLEELVQDKPAFINPPCGPEARRAHWVTPELVAEVTFTEWTEAGTLRHPSFQGLRKDKRAREVVREEPSATPTIAPANSQSPDKSTRKTKVFFPKGDKNTIAGIKISNPDKLLYPEAGITKRDLALYYEAIGGWIVPHLLNRPLTLVRCPNGWNKECFYQKHAGAGITEVIGRVTVQDSDGPAVYMTANSVSAVVAILQMGTLELHPWGARTPKLGFPDRIVFDLDPDEALAWKQITDAVTVLKTLLENLGLRGFLKTTGGKGLHVVVPIEPTVSWEHIKGFTKAIAELLAQTFPDRFTAKLLKVTRHGKIYIDYLRNAEGATAIAPYSLRAKANAPVSTPIDWSELARDLRFDHFNVKNIAARLKRLQRDPWAEIRKTRQTVTKAIMKNVGYTM